MSIIRERSTYKDVAMTMTPFISFIDELISDKATKNADGWQLSLNDLNTGEIRLLEKLQNCYGDLQSLIDMRCDDHFDYWRDSRGFDD
jgi:hypothetical protein